MKFYSLSDLFDKIENLYIEISIILIPILIYIFNKIFCLWWPVFNALTKHRRLSFYEFEILCRYYFNHFNMWYNSKKIKWTDSDIDSLEEYCSEYKYIWSKDPNYIISKLKQ